MVKWEERKINMLSLRRSETTEVIPNGIATLTTFARNDTFY